jgi:hypothetical protein
VAGALRTRRLSPFRVHVAYHLQLRNPLAQRLFVYTNTVFRTEHYRKHPEIYKLFCRFKAFVHSAKRISKVRRKGRWAFGRSNWYASSFVVRSR